MRWVRRSASDPAAEEPAVAFLLEELRNAEEEFRRLRAEGYSRLTGFLTVTGATVGLVATLSGVQGIDPVALRRVVFAAALFVALMGTNAFVGLVVRDIGTDMCARAAARVRQYFLLRYPDIDPHVTWQRVDDPTVWVSRPRSVSRRQVGFITAGAWGGSAAALIIVVDRHLNGVVAGAAGVIVAVLAWAVLVRWARRRLRSVADRARREQRFGR
jgi:hypothetical protein